MRRVLQAVALMQPLSCLCAWRRRCHGDFLISKNTRTFLLQTCATSEQLFVNFYDHFLCGLLNFSSLMRSEVQMGVRYRCTPSSLTTSFCQTINNKTRKKAVNVLHLEKATQQRRLTKSLLVYTLKRWFMQANKNNHRPGFKKQKLVQE